MLQAQRKLEESVWKGFAFRAQIKGGSALKPEKCIQVRILVFKGSSTQLIDWLIGSFIHSFKQNLWSIYAKPFA